MSEPKPIFKRQMEVPIYRSKLFLCVADTIQAAHDAAEKFHKAKLPAVLSGTRAQACHDTDGWYSLMFERGNLRPRHVAHELFHITARIMQFHSVAYDPDNHEAFAYLNDWLTEWVYQSLKRAGEVVA